MNQLHRKGYLICPVRDVTPGVQAYIDHFVESKSAEGWDIHNPKYDAPQNDPTGIGIYQAHLQAILPAERIFIIWDKNSYGSHVDLGIAMALGKPIELVTELHPDGPSKSFAKIIKDIQQHGPLVQQGRLIRPAP